ncbi:uncharacterized protein [Chelonus insularis]|uniref:uncharacterized protein n=1 Tax=Chelonus insularis TaxID=460826 RepID=UPI0015896BDF|nr:uncharacterized protein LOC118064335 [Chelonus insularis]
MIRFVIALGIIAFCSGVHGIPVMNGVRATHPSAIEDPKTKDEISIQPSWSFPSIPPMNRLFRNVEFDENEIELLKRRIENLERSQKEIYELMKKILHSTCRSPLCNNEESSEIKNSTSLSKSQEIVHERKLIVPSVIFTTTLPSTIDYALKNVAQSTASVKPVEDKKSETIAPTKSEQSTMMTTSENPIDQSTIPNSSDDNKSNLSLNDKIRNAE